MASTTIEAQSGASHSTILGYDRTLLWYDRTLLAWVRTQRQQCLKSNQAQLRANCKEAVSKLPPKS